ncbi:hypothetical protein [Paractinoplanes atraurantiacus]|uniref:Uncharacterized protein n=1 Tax=Paractinoplanes atraurantiacus TaxID=1036182 RepID=A0A285K350_9ACTN|nr:hypothetical protein [Actinoplanes atraurantiacus]SNY67019.1 hypothetical protein SAMN05421748_13116 [Actinoplanes atraurantiacus]
MELRTRLLILRCDYLLRRANRQRRRRLAAELAMYSNHDELNDLHALLDTYPDGQTHEIRQILYEQAVRRAR